MMPAIDDLPVLEALKCCGEILRRVAVKNATLAAAHAKYEPDQLNLFDIEEVQQ